MVRIMDHSPATFPGWPGSPVPFLRCHSSFDSEHVASDPETCPFVSTSGVCARSLDFILIFLLSELEPSQFKASRGSAAHDVVDLVASFVLMSGSVIFVVS